ncbi:AbrB/MazE/SpoVT family DNA-binding domain-containing protein [Candidatus Bathyarchaeota archaeon]|nr:AbrB/MazE/SpoVT family DNA-binding domain-containing protein [Candidatus Bathyarchaeota archaeon]
MPVKFEIKAVQVGNSIKITIPKEMTKHLGIKKGDTVSMWADNSHIIIEKKSP